MPIIERSLKSLSAAFEEAIGIECTKIEIAEGGLDNSVYFIYSSSIKPKYVVKIIESKTIDQITSTINLSNSLSDLTSLSFINNKTDQPIHSSSLLDKDFVVMNFIDGRHPNMLESQDDCIRIALFAAQLHNKSINSTISFRSAIDQELTLISRYYSRNMLILMSRVKGSEHDWYEERSKLYKSCNSILEEIITTNKKINDESYYVTIGISHGDLNARNLIFDKENNLGFIDPDAMDANGCQILDLLQALSKSNILHNKERSDEFLDTYLIKNKACNLDKELMYILLFCISFRSALSTDYYTKDVGSIPKITSSWVYKNAKETLDSLSNSLVNTADILGLSERLKRSKSDYNQLTI